MGIKKKYVRNPKLLEADVITARHRKILFRRPDYYPPRKRTRMIGKRELLLNGIRNESRVGEYLSLPGNEHRRISKKTLEKVRRNAVGR